MEADSIKRDQIKKLLCLFSVNELNRYSKFRKISLAILLNRSGKPIHFVFLPIASHTPYTWKPYSLTIFNNELRLFLFYEKFYRRPNFFQGSLP